MSNIKPETNNREKGTGRGEQGKEEFFMFILTPPLPSSADQLPSKKPACWASSPLLYPCSLRTAPFSHKINIE
jgi:hypothetical protein